MEWNNGHQFRLQENVTGAPKQSWTFDREPPVTSQMPIGTDSDGNCPTFRRHLQRLPALESVFTGLDVVEDIYVK